MIEKYQVILLCAGKGERMGLPLNKIFYEIEEGKKVIDYSLKLFNEDYRCDKIVIVYNVNDKEILFDVLEEYKSNKIETALGGSLRQDSVLKGLSLITSDYVLVHDVARPNINLELVNNVLDGFDKYDSVSLGVKVSDTIKKISSNLTTVDRDNLYYMQTPQGAKTCVLKEALEMVSKKGIVVTDDLQAIEYLHKYNIGIVPGKKSNIKLTTLEDLQLIKFYMERKDV